MSELLFTTEEPPDWRALGWVDLGCTEEGLVWTGDMPRAMDTRELAARVRGDRPAGEPLWTIGDALAFLDPQPNRRTLSRWLRGLEPIGTRELPQGGPPARLYRAREVMQRHTVWASENPG